MERVPTTAEGLKVLEDELKQLKSVERPAIIKAIAAAREHGDLSENAEYTSARERQGFTVIQVMVLHRPEMANPLTGPALVDGDVARPRVTPGNDPSKPGEYDYWDHLDWVVDRAAAHGLYVALVPAWGTFAEMRKLTVENAPIYGRFLAERYKDKPNIIWINGGDTHADMATLTGAHWARRSSRSTTTI